MNKSIFLYRELTRAEVGNAGTHEKYVRLPNNFDYNSFFHDTAVQNGSVLEINFNAIDTTDGTPVNQPLRFVCFANSNQEKRIPSLGPLFQSHNIKEGDIVCLESRLIDGKCTYYIHFYKKGEIQIEPNSIYYSIIEKESKKEIPKDGPLQQIFYGAPGTGKSDTIFERTKDLPKEDVYRTTFHPDSDYASFVGSYKPKMNDRTVYGAQGPLRNSRGEEISEPKITYTFSPQAFTNAYIRAWQTDEPVFLIIEEINRGNCAQIFGDLFQLLDRDENGYSKYDIVPDSDLSDYIKGKLEDAAEKEGLTSHIKEGKILKLPNNLYIWATMNTSDQSLFPIDSAFKRRWEWKYIKIKKGIDKKTGAELDWKIKVGEDNSYDWWEFLKAINYKIDKMTSSADKQLGYFFCLADRNGEINIDTFVNKVAFYLWNDVFKDYAEDGSPLLKYKKNEEDKSESDLTFPDFFDQSGEIDKNVVKQFIEKVMKEDDMDKPAE